MAEAAGVAVEAAGLVSAGYRRCLGRPRGVREPLAVPCSGRRSRGPAGTTEAGPPAEAHGRPEAAYPRVPLAWGGSLRLSGRRLDLRPHCTGPRGGVRRPLPQGPRRPAAPGTALDAPGAG